MTFIDHSILWLKGEILEGAIIGIVGFIILLCGLAFWKFGHNPGGKAFIIPMVICGALFLSAGGSMSYFNNKKIQEFQQTYTNNPAEFVVAEKKRVEGFQYLYKTTIYTALILFALAIIAQFVTTSQNIKAISIALSFIGVSGLTIDYFSKERADIYYNEIVKEIHKVN